MDLFTAVKKRYSCRQYKTRPVAKNDLERILEAGRLAPSAHNAQDWHFVLVSNLSVKKQLAKAANQDFLAQAPLIIVGVGLEPNHLLSSENPACVVDVTIALTHMVLAATTLGLASCWVGSFKQEEVKKNLKIPKEYQVVALLPLGYPADQPKTKIRKKLTEIISWEEFKK